MTARAAWMAYVLANADYDDRCLICGSPSVPLSMGCAATMLRYVCPSCDRPEFDDDQPPEALEDFLDDLRRMGASHG